MTELRDYLYNNTERLQRGTAPSETTDVVFFEVRATGGADAETLKDLCVKNQAGEMADVDLFDGEEHSYLELGAWLGDQGDALALMGLGASIGLWKLLTPRTVLGSVIDSSQEQHLAGAGLISIVVPKKA